MGQMIQRGKELMRINPSKRKRLEYSNNNGATWQLRYESSNASNTLGEFTDLIDNGKELLATTSNGLYYSNDNGVIWHKRSN